MLIDEVQDLLSKKMKIIVNIASKSKTIHVYIAGDYLQTLFTESFISKLDNESLDAHAMNIFKRLKAYTYFVGSYQASFKDLIFREVA